MKSRSAAHQLIDYALSTIPTDIPLNSRIIVGLSGGVDSSVSAALLKELGYDVVGLFMKNWEEDEGDASSACPAEVDFRDVAHTANVLGIPYFSVNFAKEYKDEVFQSFLDGLKQGRTPNPDILCNLEIKFKHLLHKALSLEASALATGHYAGISYETHKDETTEYFLERAVDLTKDQTYFLYTASQKTLPHTIFPLHKLKKTEVREIARLFNIPVAEKKDSTGICFIGERDFRSFIAKYLGYSPGDMVTYEGKIVGKHQGLAYYTRGQRKGLGIGGQGSAWFVADKRLDTNELVVVQGEMHPALFSDELYIKSIYWVSGKEPDQFPFHCSAKIRYRQVDQPCYIEKVEASTNKDPLYRVVFSTPQRAITEEQSCVLYKGSRCLGGGIILQRGPSYYDLKKELPLEGISLDGENIKTSSPS